MAYRDFQIKNEIEFWCTLTRLSKAMQFSILFTITYFYESGFSSLIIIKIQLRNRLDVKDDMRISLSNTVSDFKAILQSKQQRMSH